MKKTILWIIVFVVSVLLVFWGLRPHPHVNKIVIVGNKYELSDTVHFCNSECKQYFSIYKRDSTESINDDDLCHKCGNFFSDHANRIIWNMWKTNDVPNN